MRARRRALSPSGPPLLRPPVPAHLLFLRAAPRAARALWPPRLRRARAKMARRRAAAAELAGRKEAAAAARGLARGADCVPVRRDGRNTKKDISGSRCRGRGRARRESLMGPCPREEVRRMPRGWCVPQSNTPPDTHHAHTLCSLHKKKPSMSRRGERGMMARVHYC